jgi:myosin-5
VKKPVEVQGRKVVALHVLMDEIPTPPSQDGVEESVLPTAGEGAQKVIHTTFENDDESEYVLVKRTSLLSNGEIALSPVTLRKLDIAILSVINEPEMLNFLRLRYNSSCRFFAIGPMMLAFTVHKRSGANTQQPMKSLPYYANNDVLSEQDASVSSLAQRMCARLCPLTGSSGAGSSISDVRNQAVLLQGESGSGKSTMTKELTQRVVAVLASFSETKIPDVKINDDVLYDMNCILETFGHSQTKSNPNSSRFSKSVKLHVDSTSQDLAGVLVRCYYLELERVTQCPAEECNFNVFYDVFDDVFFSEIAAERYAIEDITSFKYTPHKPVSRLNEPGKSAFKDLTKAFRDLLGIPKKDHRLIYGVLAAILHLGEVQLEQGEEVDGNPTVAYCEGEYGNEFAILFYVCGTNFCFCFLIDEENMDHVDRVSKLLGLSHSALLTVLTKRHVNFAGTIVAKHLSLNEAVAAKDAMASHLYLSLFKSLLSSINTAIHKKFLGKHTIFGEEEEVDAEERNEEEFDMLASRSVIALYDFPGFEYSKPSNISGLCKNYINERLYQHYYQNVYKFDAAAFADNGISVAPLNMTSNGEIVKLLDNRSNGIFTIFNDQMKLKSKQLDAKVASIMYSQHGNSTIFDSGKKERKRLWFKIRHYNYAVSYDINGFKKQNKIQPSAEMVEFLRSSTIPYVHGLLHYCEVRSSLENPHLHGLEAAPLVEQSVTSSLERSMSRGFSSRPSFQSTPSTRNFMLQRSNSDIVSVYSVGQDDESVVSASSSMSRGSRKGANGKPITLASLTQTFMEEVITEITAAEVHVVLCIKPNDVNTCKDFDNYTVSRQLAPYEMQKVLRFYTTGYPYCVSLSAFSNRYSILSTTHKISESLSKAFTKMLLKCRALGSDIKTKQAHNLIKALLNLVSNLPELESEFGPLAGHQMEGDFYFEAVQTGLKVCDECVMMTALAYSYLEAAHKIAMTLVAHLLQRFYRGRVRPMIEFQIEKVKNVCRGFVARKSWAKKRLAVIKIQSVIRMFVIKSHYDYERQILSRIIRAQAVWRGKHKRQELSHSPPPRPSWMSDAKQMTAYHAYMTPLSEKDGFTEHDTPPGEKLDYTPHTNKKESVNRFMIKPSYTTEEEDSRSNDDEENENKAMHTSRLASSSSDTPGEGSGIGMGVSESKHELQTISELQAELEAMRLENKALRKMEKKFIQQSKSMNHIEEEVAIGGDDVERLGNRAHIINKQNTSNALDAEKLRCAYDGTRLLPDYDLYSARVLNAVQDDLSYLLKPTIFYKFGHQGSVRKALICVSPCFHYIMWKPKNSMFKKSEECKVDLRKVWNLAKGQTTPAFKEYKGITHGPMPPKLSFSLIFGFRSLDFCALDEHTYRQWFQGLQYIIELINGDSSEAGVDKQYYRSRWNYLDKHRNGVLNRKSVITLVASLGIKFTNDSFLTAILRSSIGNSRSDQITFSQFSSLIYQLTRRPDLEILWANLVDGKPFEEATFPLYASKDADSTKLFDVIGLATFRKFWKDYQGRALTVSEARVVVKEGMGAKFDPNFPVLSYGGFQAIMNHEKNDAYDPVKTHHNDIEMSSPLNHYYIATADGPAVGILPPRQHGSDTTNPYHIDVKRGCRCLEIRCFEGSIAPEHIDRKHGFRSDLFVSAPDQDQSHTGLGRLTFKETVLEISRVAFTLTHLPLVIMLDFSANVSLKLQQRAAKYLEKIFDDALYLPSQVSASEVSMPSPKSLKKRVIVFLSHRGSNINAAYVLAGPNSQAGNMQRKSTKTIGSRHSEEDDGSYTAKAIDDVDDVLEWRSEVVSSPQQSLSRQQIRQHQSSSPMASAVSFYASVSPSAGSSDGPERSRAPIPIHESLFRICHYTADYRLATHDMSAIVSKLKSEPASAEQIRLYNTQNLRYTIICIV